MCAGPATLWSSATRTSKSPCWPQYRTKVTIEGGTLDVAEAGKVKQGTWTVMRTVDPITGTFDSVTSGYKAKYNVEVVEDGVTYYELQLTKSSSGTIIIIR